LDQETNKNADDLLAQPPGAETRVLLSRRIHLSDTALCGRCICSGVFLAE